MHYYLHVRCIDANYAVKYPHLITQRLASFMLWVAPMLKPKKGRLTVKPDSVLAYPLAIMRNFDRRKVLMPKAKALKGEINGLKRAFTRCYGGVASAPHRRQPMSREIWAAIEGLREGAQLPGRQPWSPKCRRRDAAILGLGRVLWRSGHRVGEITGSGRLDDINFLTRASVTFVLSKVIVVDPTPAQLALRKPGDVVNLGPCTSKPDQFGMAHCPFPSVLPFDGSPTCAAAYIFNLELQEPCRGKDREITPLFCDENGRAYTYDILNRELFLLLKALFGVKVATSLSWHSIRIGLACALMAANCPDHIIQLICRWESPESLKAYRRLGITQHVGWTNSAASASIDATQVANLPILENEWLSPGDRSAADERLGREVMQAARLELPAVPARNKAGVWHPDDVGVVPADVYPQEDCDEGDGTGWLVRVVSVAGLGPVANLRLTFVLARSLAGRPFADVSLQARAIQARAT
jgi:hypothetical protein